MVEKLIATIIIVIISLFTGAVVGGVLGFVTTAQLENDNIPSVASPSVVEIESTLPESVTATTPSISAETQTLIITEESTTIDAVEKALPAVVTVLSQSGFDGESGSGFL